MTVKTSLTLAAALLVALAGTAHAAPVAPCRSAQLRATFSVVPGSAGAGNIVYTLALRNRSSATCFVSGLPLVRLLGRSGRALPTHVVPAQPGAGTAVMVRLAPGERAKATARFSPYPSYLSRSATSLPSTAFIRGK